MKGTFLYIFTYTDTATASENLKRLQNFILINLRTTYYNKALFKIFTVRK